MNVVQILIQQINLYIYQFAYTEHARAFCTQIGPSKNFGFRPIGYTRHRLIFSSKFKFLDRYLLCTFETFAGSNTHDKVLYFSINLTDEIFTEYKLINLMIFLNHFSDQNFEVWLSHKHLEYKLFCVVVFGHLCSYFIKKMFTSFL